MIGIIIIIKNKQSKQTNYGTYYKRLFFLRKSEIKFLKSIDILEDEYAIIPKLSLRKIIKTDDKRYKKELRKLTVDYAIFDKTFYRVLLLIELEYQSEEINNKAKIEKLKEICDDAGISFITFKVNSNNNETETIYKIKEIIRKNI